MRPGLSSVNRTSTSLVRSWSVSSLPLRADVPAEDQSVWWLEGEHPGPAAFGAVHAAVVDVAAYMGLEHRLLDLDVKQVVVLEA